MNPRSLYSQTIIKVKGDARVQQEDVLSVEEPLEIILEYGPQGQRKTQNLSITMRTPGNDYELAVGFLVTEGILNSYDDILDIDYTADALKLLEINDPNKITVQLSYDLEMNWDQFSRHFYTNSSCGVCGKTSIESLYSLSTAIVKSDFTVSARIIHKLNDTMRVAQGIFSRTGSLHAAALFNEHGTMMILREDIGRHNALDKVIGSLFLSKQMPSHRSILLLSGRSCFELIQKALVAGIPIVGAVGAPSSLAVQTAENFGICLLGFVKNDGFNIYSAADKIMDKRGNE